VIGIVDYGLGNSLAVKQAYREIGVKAVLLKNPNDMVNGIKGLVIPGVGSFGEGVSMLKNSSWFEYLKNNGCSGMPILGICLGIQLLFKSSEEDPSIEGIGLISADVLKLPAGRARIPNMGWRIVKNYGNSQLLNGLSGIKFYHVHSYGFIDNPKEGDSSITVNGLQVIVAVRSKNVFGVQFHPEKSLKQGLSLLRNYYTFCCNENYTNITDQ
jgi:imidazole glycerol-phosphate synthase subunit HisH